MPSTLCPNAYQAFDPRLLNSVIQLAASLPLCRAPRGGDGDVLSGFFGDGVCFAAAEVDEVGADAQREGAGGDEAGGVF